MIQRLIPVLIIAAVAICIVQLINHSFTSTYTSIESSLQKPYAQAQDIYQATANEY